MKEGGSVRRHGKESHVYDEKYYAEGGVNRCYHLVELPGEYEATNKEEKDGLEEKRRKEGGSMLVPPLECREVNLPSTSSKEVDSWISVVVVLGLPLFAEQGTKTSSATHKEAGGPKASDRNRGT